MIQFDLASMALAWASGAESHDQAGRRLLWHQQRTRELLRDHDLVINSYPTGAGKTHAALLRLLDRPKTGWQANALVIAPTNELVGQHRLDAEQFCREQGLPHEGIELTRKGLQREQLPDTFERRGERLYRLLLDVRVARSGEQRPILAVGNPDIFHLGLYFRYNQLDQRNIFRQLVQKFGYLVIDELHYYSAKQLATFLFFIALSREYGYFEHGRQLALLSATPEPRVPTLLAQLGLRVAYLKPDREPADAETTPSLAPARVRLFPAGRDQGLELLVPAEREQIGLRLEAGQQGAVISSALWRINLVFDALRRTRFGSRVGRISGPETPEQRAAAQTDLILATRTVDIGYNFGRPDKERQSLDLVYCDATFDDELLQRLGRAGRVLGRRVTDQPSEITAIVSAALYQLLEPFDDQRVSRAELAARLAAEPAVARDRLFNYLQTSALGEVILPLHQLARMTAVEQLADVEQAFEAVRTVFAPGSRASYTKLRGKMRHFLALEQRHRKPPASLERRLELGFEAFLRAEGGGYHAAERAQFRAGILGQNNLRERFEAWWDGEAEAYACMAAGFAFRDSFEEPVALVWDPGCCLSAEPKARYSLLHLLENYELEFDPDPAAWSKRSRLLPEPADAFVTIQRPRPPADRLRVRLRLRARDDYRPGSLLTADPPDLAREPTRDEWLADRSAAIHAFRGLRLELVSGQLPSGISGVLVERPVVGLVIHREAGALAGRLWSVCTAAGFFPRDLVVSAARGQTAECLLLLGSPALQVAAELRGLLQGAQRKASQQAAPFIT